MDRIVVEQKVLSENDRVAARLRERFREHGILCVNIISSPGSGKTSFHFAGQTCGHPSG